jgi:hypothetical protein
MHPLSHESRVGGKVRKRKVGGRILTSNQLGEGMNFED